MAGRKSDFTLTRLDDLFSTQEQRDEEKLSKIRDIPLELIDDFPDHPFKVRDDEDMQQLVESIKERGVITPATVRQKEDGRYELISGHRRKRASELAGFDTLRNVATVEIRFTVMYALQTLFPNCLNLLMRGELKCDRLLNCRILMRTVSVMWWTKLI